MTQSQMHTKSSGTSAPAAEVGATKLQKAIRQWQEREGLSRMMAAQKAGVSYFTLAGLMSGATRRPSAQTIQKLVLAGVVIDTEVLKSL